MAAWQRKRIYVTTKYIPRTRIFDLPYNFEITCNRVEGWSLWNMNDIHNPKLLGGEYDGASKALCIDIDGHIIMNSFGENNASPAEEKQSQTIDQDLPNNIH